MQFISVATLAPRQAPGTFILTWREATASLVNFAVHIGAIESLRFEEQAVVSPEE